MAFMTFEQFKATRRESGNLFADLGDVGQWGETIEDRIPCGFIYEGGLYIEMVTDKWPQKCRDEGKYYLILERSEFITDDLETLEHRLYQFGLSSGAVDRPKNLLTLAIVTDDLDDALVRLMNALGIDSGDVAAQAFSEYDDANEEWKNGDVLVRRDMLTKWLAIELIWAVPDAPTDRERITVRMRAEGYGDWHTGGGCRAWGKNFDDGYHVMICDEGQGLGDKFVETYLVGLYDSEGDFECDDVKDLEAAIAWCAERAAEPKKFIDAARGTKNGVRAVS